MATSNDKTLFDRFLAPALTKVTFLLIMPFASIQASAADYYDVIIVGSGFGGSVAAYNLSQAGIETVVIERGRWWEVADPTGDNTFATLD